MRREQVHAVSCTYLRGEDHLFYALIKHSLNGCDRFSDKGLCSHIEALARLRSGIPFCILPTVLK